MNRKQKIQALVILWVILAFLVLLSDKNIENIAYLLNRFKYGGFVKIEGRCFVLPKGWFIVGGGSSDRYADIVIAKKKNDGYELASIVLGSEGRFVKRENSIAVEVIDGHLEIYELDNLNEEVRARYWSRDASGKVVVGQSIRSVRDIMLEAESIACE